ncbi:MAG: DUF5103 domain-containing protein [Prolixibacteraceae bacterium]|nr:DUF5103 domain-containing protein [Prolixibacteraceae bacterium]
MQFGIGFEYDELFSIDVNINLVFILKSTLMRLRYLIMFAFGFLLFPGTGSGIELPEVLRNKVFNENIKTVELYREGWKLSNPVLTLGNDEQLVFTFDDLSAGQSDYYYTFFHCDRNWQISSLNQSEYFDSFTEFPVTDSEYSVNTTIPYTNYLLRIPNDDVPIRYSGNYILIVFAREKPDVPVITRRFYVVEQRVDIQSRIRKASNQVDGVESQEVNFNIDYGNFSINNPSSDIKVVVRQNNRHDNQIEDLDPLYMSNGVLEYDYNTGNVFPGVNEFRFFEFRNVKHPGKGVWSIDYLEPMYNVTLENHKPRVQEPYSYQEDLNGNYYIEVTNSDYPELEADYMLVHFTLDMAQPLLGGGIYIFGKLSNWECTEPFKMSYNMEQKRYEHSIVLKQGSYSFLYAYKDDFTGKIKPYNIEGSHSETENDYQIFVYYGEISDRYDRLIGYNQFNSSRNRSY